MAPPNERAQPTLAKPRAADACRDFTETRLNSPPGDVRRVCAHLFVIGFPFGPNHLR
jgi:hypothetical protein